MFSSLDNFPLPCVIIYFSQQMGTIPSLHNTKSLRYYWACSIPYTHIRHWTYMVLCDLISSRISPLSFHISRIFLVLCDMARLIPWMALGNVSLNIHASRQSVISQLSMNCYSNKSWYITTKFCTCHDSTAVLVCAELGCGHISGFLAIRNLFC